MPRSDRKDNSSNSAPSPTITVVVPCYNESSNLETLLGELSTVLSRLKDCTPEIVFVDDGSRDDTWSVITNLASDRGAAFPISGIRFTRNFGKDQAIAAGLEVARGEAVITIDADLQHPPELVEEMVKLWREESYDIVQGVKEQRQQESSFDRFIRQTYYRTLRLLSGIDLARSTDYKLITRKVLTTWNSLHERGLFYRGLTAWTGFQTKDILFTPPSRHSGTSGWSYWRLFLMGSDAIISFSAIPLSLIGALGIIFILGAVALALRSFQVWIAGEAASGITTVILLQLFIGGSILLSLALIGKYLAMVYNEVKGRPRYVVQDRVRFGGG